MKKSLPNQRTALQFFSILCVMLLFSNFGWGQQVIGSFPYMNGGFEGQTAGALGTTLSSTLWTRQNETGASSSIVTTSPRTGANYATVTNVTAVSRGLHSPQLTPFVAANSPTVSTAYIVQFWVKNAATINTWTVSPNTNGTGSPSYGTAITLPINASWTKYTVARTSSSTAVTSAGIAVIGRSAAGTFDVDDVVIYPGSAPPSKTHSSFHDPPGIQARVRLSGCACAPRRYESCTPRSSAPTCSAASVLRLLCRVR